MTIVRYTRYGKELSLNFNTKDYPQVLIDGELWLVMIISSAVINQ